MRRISIAALTAALIILIGGCGSPAPSPTTSLSSTASVTVTASTTTSSPAATTTNATTTTPTAPTIGPGDIALFGTVSGGVNSDSLKIIGGDIFWDTTHYEFLRYVPSVPALDSFGWTNSKSYAHSYMWGFTQDGWVYRVRASTDTGSKEVTRIDPKTGATKGSFPTIYTSDRYKGFTVFGDRLIYRSRIGTNLAGSRTSGGHIMEVTFGGSGETKLLDYGDPNALGSYYAIGTDLLMIQQTKVEGIYYYDIFKVDPDTLQIDSLLYTYMDPDFAVKFFAGDTALYWSQTDPDTGDLLLIQFEPAGEPHYFVTIAENSPQLVSIDESNGIVLIVSTDDSPDSPFYTTVNLKTDEIADLVIDNGFFSTLIYGAGQFLVLE